MGVSKFDARPAGLGPGRQRQRRQRQRDGCQQRLELHLARLAANLGQLGGIVNCFYFITK